MLDGGTILVAGATGFLGAALTGRLLAMGARVRGTHFSRPPSRQHPALHWRHADLTRAEGCAAACEGVSAVFMCAAQTAGAAVIVNTPLAQVTPNVLMNTLMLEAAHRAGVRKFAFISSGAAYPDLGDDHLLREDDMFRADPPPVYYAAGWMKRYAEVLCRTYAETTTARPMATVVVRPSNVYGPGDKWDFATSHVTAAQLRRVIERAAPIEVWGDGEDARDLIYIDDFLDGLLLAFAADRPFLTVNIASGKIYRVRDIVRTAIDVDGYRDAVVTFDPNKPRTIRRRMFDTSFAKAELGFAATIPLEVGFRQTMEWFRQMHHIEQPKGMTHQARKQALLF